MDDWMDSVGLLLVDVQPKILDLIENGQAVLKRNCFAVEAARLLGVKIFYTEQVPEKLGGTCAELMEAGLKDVQGFPKSAFSALKERSSVLALQNAGVQHVVVTGIETSVCVYQTVMDAKRLEMDVTVLSDCVGARRPEDHRAVVCAFQQMGLGWLPSETLFYSMLGSAEHPRFREFTSLVKRYA